MATFNIHRLRAAFLFVSFIISIISSGCAGLGDYEFDVAGGYKLLRINALEVVVLKESVGYQKGMYIPPKVVEVAWDDRFVIAKQLGFTDIPGKGSMPDEMKVGYWILDTTVKKAHGPYNLEDFEKNRQLLGVSPDIILKNVQKYPKKK